MKKTLFFLIAIIPSLVSAQMDEFYVARDDASAYLKHYLNPAFNGLMYALNSGWYSQSKTHKTLGFDMSLSFSLAFVPESEQYFRFNPDEYQYLSQNGSDVLPTVAGGSTGETLKYHSGTTDYDIDALDGLKDEWEAMSLPVFIPAPMVQTSLGLPLHTDVIVRFFPKTTKEHLSFYVLGGGIKHDLTPYLKKEKSSFNIAAVVVANRISLTYLPDNFDIQGSDQRLNMLLNTFMVQVLAGVHFKLINFYGGIGYVSGNTSVRILGNYEFDVDDNGSISSDEIVTDPLQLSFVQSGIKSTIGARINLGPLKIFGDYSLQKYQTVTAGLAISIR